MKAAVGKWCCLASLFALLVNVAVAAAADSDWNRRTLAGIQGVYVIIEELQPNIQRYAPKANLTTEQLRKDVEAKLKKGGIRILAQDEWLKTKGRPTLYVNINTHAFEKYSYAYDIRLEFQQVVQMEANATVRLLTDTWSISQTGAFNIGSLQTVKTQLGVLVDRFVEAYLTANKRQ